MADRDGYSKLKDAQVALLFLAEDENLTGNFHIATINSYLVGQVEPAVQNVQAPIFDPDLLHSIPAEVIEAEHTISTFFNRSNSVHWEFGGIQKRVAAPSQPVATQEDAGKAQVGGDETCKRCAGTGDVFKCMSNGGPDAYEVMGACDECGGVGAVASQPSNAVQDAPIDALPYGIVDPDYARVFTMARCLAWAEGYAITMHGSFTRDLDLLAVPWADRVCEPEHLVRRIEAACGLKQTRQPPSERPHGRLTWTLLFPEFGDPRFVDLSVMTLTTTANAGKDAK